MAGDLEFHLAALDATKALIKQGYRGGDESQVVRILKERAAEALVSVDWPPTQAVWRWLRKLSELDPNASLPKLAGDVALLYGLRELVRSEKHLLKIEEPEGGTPEFDAYVLVICHVADRYSALYWRNASDRGRRLAEHLNDTSDLDIRPAPAVVPFDC